MSVGLDVSQVVIAGGAAIIWIIRLEGRISGLKREMELLEKRVDDHHGVLKNLTEVLSSVKEALARIETKLED